MQDTKTNNRRAQEATDRRELDDAARRLRDEVPRLASLRIEVDESRGERKFMQGKYAREVVVERAPARFEIACGDELCRNGGHDLSFEILRALRAGLTEFEAEGTCNGEVGTAQCLRLLHCMGRATYRDLPEATDAGRGSQ